VTDFSYVMQITGFVFGTAVRADSRWQSFDALMREAREKPGTLTYSTSGIATTNHLAMEEILARRGGRMEHIPTRGAQEGVTMLLGRQIDVVADAQSWRPQVESGEFRLLSAWTPTRLGSAPNTPTLLELGFGMSVTSPYGIVGPKGMEPEVVNLLHRSLKKALDDELCQAIVRRWELPNEYLGPQEYLAFARERVLYEQDMVRRLNLSID
jgi:tripartite-type tricarboxylate transporter receptor subunit TctC